MTIMGTDNVAIWSYTINNVRTTDRLDQPIERHRVIVSLSGVTFAFISAVDAKQCAIGRHNTTRIPATTTSHFHHKIHTDTICYRSRLRVHHKNVALWQQCEGRPPLSGVDLWPASTARIQSRQHYGVVGARRDHDIVVAGGVREQDQLRLPRGHGLA